MRNGNQLYGLVACSWIAALPALATTWDVHEGESIQAAIDDAARGDSILIWPGYYTESLEIDKTLSLLGQAGASATTLDAGNAGRCIYALKTEFGDAVTIAGLSFVGVETGYGFDGAAIVGNGDLTVEDCVFGSPGESMSSVRWFGLLAVRDSEVLGDAAYQVANILLDNGQATVERTVFSGNSTEGGGATVAVEEGSLLVRACTFTDQSGLGTCVGLGYGGSSREVSVDVEDCLFSANAIPCIASYNPPVRARPANHPLAARLGMRRTTIANCQHGVILVVPNTVLDACAITGCRIGAFVSSSSTVTCMNVWGNETNWFGIPDPTGTNGNISLAPRYCAPQAGHFTVGADSPHLPENNSCGVLIGALPEGCGIVSTSPTSWGRLKALFR